MANSGGNVFRRMNSFVGDDRFDRKESKILVRIEEMKNRSPFTTLKNMASERQKLIKIFQDQDSCIFLNRLMEMSAVPNKSGVMSVNKMKCNNGSYEMVGLQPLNDNHSFAASITIAKENTYDVISRTENISCDSLDIVKETIDGKTYKCAVVLIRNIQRITKVAVSFLLEALLTAYKYLQVFYPDHDHATMESYSSFRLQCVTQDNIDSEDEKNTQRLAISMINRIIQKRNKPRGTLNNFLFNITGVSDSTLNLKEEFNEIKPFLLRIGITPAAIKKLWDGIEERKIHALYPKDITICCKILPRSTFITNQMYFYEGR